MIKSSIPVFELVQRLIGGLDLGIEEDRGFLHFSMPLNHAINDRGDIVVTRFQIACARRHSLAASHPFARRFDVIGVAASSADCTRNVGRDAAK
jgi:hypothetical protein